MSTKPKTTKNKNKYKIDEDQQIHLSQWVFVLE